MADEVVVVEPVVEVPAVAPAPTAEEVAERLRQENARLRGENQAYREIHRDAAVPAATPTADPIASELDAINAAFAAGRIDADERTVRLGALGARGEIAKREREQADGAARSRDEQAKAKSGQKIAAYMEKHPGLGDANSPEMARVLPHLRAVAEEFGLDGADPRAQVLALERAYGPIDRSAVVDTREFERVRHPGGGGGGGSYVEEPPAPKKPVSEGERIFNMLTPESQEFFLTTRGSKEAAIKTLAYADETLMRRQGRFR